MPASWGHSKTNLPAFNRRTSANCIARQHLSGLLPIRGKLLGKRVCRTDGRSISELVKKYVQVMEIDASAPVKLSSC